MKMTTLILLFLFSFKIQSAESLDNFKQDIVSPFTTPAIGIFEVGAGLTFLTYFLKKGSLQSDIARNKPLGSSSKIGYKLGQAIPNIAYALIMSGDYLFSKNEKSLERSILMTKATLYSY